MATSLANGPADQSFFTLKLLGTFSSYYDSIVDLILQCVDAAGDLYVYATFGRLVGTDGRSVHLPVATECIVTSTTECTFQEELQTSLLEACLPRLLHASHGTWHWRSLFPQHVIERYYDDDTTVEVNVIPSDAQKQTDGQRTYVRVSPLGNLLVYLPKSSLHLRVCCVARKLVDTAPPGAIPLESSTERVLEAWQAFPPRQQRRDFSWTLIKSTTRVRSSDVAGEPFSAERSFEGGSPNTLSASLREEWSTSLRFYGDRYQLQRHLVNYAREKRHGVRRFVVDLLQHAKDIVRVFQDATSHDDMLGPYYFPSFLGDIVSQTRRHYNLKRITAASESRIETLRRLNNEAKQFLIQAYVPEEASVLDLACGHGQDVLKYAKKRLRRFVGIDISNEEIREAIRRVSEHRSHLTQQGAWEFHVGDLLNPSCYKVVDGEQFDVISIQLAIHYCIETEQAAEALLSQVAKHLKPGGVFLGSTGCCQTIASRLLNKLRCQKCPAKASSPQFSFGNSVYRVELTSEMLEKATGMALPSIVAPPPDSDGMTPTSWPFVPTTAPDVLHDRLHNIWGIRYLFNLVEHIHADEFVVPWNAFCRVASRHGLHFVQHETFDGLLALGDKFSSELREWKRRHLGRLRFDDEQMEAFSFYKGFVFSKGPLSYRPDWMRSTTITPVAPSRCEVAPSMQPHSSRSAVLLGHGAESSTLPHSSGTPTASISTTHDDEASLPIGKTTANVCRDIDMEVLPPHVDHHPPSHHPGRNDDDDDTSSSCSSSSTVSSSSSSSSLSSSSSGSSSSMSSAPCVDPPRVFESS